MTMKKIFVILAVFIATAGCSDWLDVNTDPNNPTEVDVDLILPAGQASLAVRLGGTLFNMGGFFAQYWAQAPEANQYNVLETYDLRTDFLDGDYTEMFAGGLNDLERVRTDASAVGDWGNYLAATVVRAYIYQVWVDMVDRVPYSEALKGTEFINPTWEEGEVVYAGLIDELDNAIDSITSESRVAVTDLIFESDVAEWVGLANALKLKLLMRQRFVNDVSSEVTALIADHGNFMTTDAAFKGFSSEVNKRNPWYETTQQLNTDRNHVATVNMIRFLNSNGDPRIGSIYNVAEASSTHEGIYPAEKQTTSGLLTSDYSRPKVAATQPVSIFSMAELYLFIAEAELIFNNDKDAAKDAFEMAIDANFAWRGLANAADMYEDAADSYYFDVADSNDDLFEQIMMQKWVCLAAVNNFEAWVELRRTDIPAYWGNYSDFQDGGYIAGQYLDPARNLLPDGFYVPNRLPYPDIAVSRNEKTPALTGTNSFTQKVWWDVN